MSAEITERLARIETKVDIIIEHGRDHEKRVRSLERENWLHRGAAAIVAFIATRFTVGIPWH
jgi:hypothetical protein